MPDDTVGADAADQAAVVRGSIWLISAGAVSRALGIVGTLILTHLITPLAYGEVSDAVVVIYTANMLANAGVGVYVIAHPHAEPGELFHAALLHIGLGALFIVPVLIFGPLLGPAFGAPTMGRYLPGLAIAVMAERVNMLPERLIFRQMRFGVSSLQRAGAEVLFTLVSVAGAAAGWGGMAIVAGNVARSACRTPLLFVLVSWREWLAPCRLRREVFARILRFGLPISLGQLLGFGLRRWDNLMVSHFHGAAAAGAYNLAYNLADIPAVQIGEQITDALQVSMARSRDTTPERQLVRSLAALAFIMTPMAVGLGAVAPTLAVSFLDRRWIDVGPMLMWLSVISFPRPLSGLGTAYMQVKHRRPMFLALDVFTVLVLLLSLATLGRLSPVAACIAVGATFFLRLAGTGFLLWKIDGVPLWDFFRPQIPPVIAALIMAAVVTAVRLALGHLGAPGVVSLIAQVVIGIAAYAAAAWFVARDAFRQFSTLLRTTLGRRLRRKTRISGPGAGAATT
ncbi:MAG TPA: oligosaccharide flippase family protein [Polyangia bacterium]|nr:oligosaccharide flippase family protein [Polyangia bacterium]